MIREIAAALGGVLSGLIAFLFVLLYPSTLNATSTDTGIFRQIPITGPMPGQIYAGPNFAGGPGIYSGVLPALVLLLLAVASGIILSQVGRIRLQRDVTS